MDYKDLLYALIAITTEQIWSLVRHAGIRLN